MLLNRKKKERVTGVEGGEEVRKYPHHRGKEGGRQEPKGGKSAI